jgi:hypothetical protein
VKRLALVGGQLYPAPLERPISDSVVLIEDGKIIAVGEKDRLQIPPDAETLDCTGRTIVAGFWNSHVHFTEPKWQNASDLPATRLTDQLQRMLTRYGFTSVVDTGSPLPNTLVIRRRVESGEVSGPRILTAGLPLYPKEGVPYYVVDSVPPDVLKLLPQPATNGTHPLSISGSVDISKTRPRYVHGQVCPRRSGRRRLARDVRSDEQGDRISRDASRGGSGVWFLRAARSPQLSDGGSSLRQGLPTGLVRKAFMDVTAGKQPANCVLG